MKHLFKTKIACLVIGTGLLMASCGTSNDVVSGGMFSKRKYTKGYHSNLRRNIQSDDQQTVSEKLKGNESAENTFVLSGNSSTVLADKIPSSVENATALSSEKAFESSLSTDTEKGSIKEKSNRSLVNVKKNKVDNIATEKDSKLSPSSFNALKKASKKMAPKPMGDGGILHIILIIILVLVIISLLSFIGGPLGSLLSLIVLILLILLILRALGVI